MRLRRGFSLLEIVVVVAIVALLLAVAIPSFTRSRQNANIESEISALSGRLTRSRVLATRGEVIDTAVPPTASRSAGLRIAANNAYVLYVSTAADGVGGTERVVEASQFPPESDLTIIEPAVGAAVRFRHNGTLVTGGPTRVVLRDGAGRQHVLNLTLTGQVSRQ